VTTVQPGESVRIDLKNRSSGVYAYAGKIVAADARAIRLRDVFRVASFGGENPHSTRTAGDVTVPWTSIQSVRVIEEVTK
jgi:hypothetical protein